MNYGELKEKIFSEIEKYREELTVLNDNLADNPEISGEEYETSKKIVKLLKSHGYQVEYPFAGRDTAFKGVYGENQHTHKVAILTEYDALSVRFHQHFSRFGNERAAGRAGHGYSHYRYARGGNGWG